MRGIVSDLLSQNHVDRRPFVVDSAAKIIDNVKTIKKSLGDKAQICFPLNARHTLRVLSILRSEGISAQVESGADMHKINACKLPQGECIVNGTSHYSDNKLRDFIDGDMLFRIYSTPDLKFLKEAMQDHDGRILVANLKRVKVKLPSESFPNSSSSINSLIWTGDAPLGVLP